MAPATTPSSKRRMETEIALQVIVVLAGRRSQRTPGPPLRRVERRLARGFLAPEPSIAPKAQRAERHHLRVARRRSDALRHRCRQCAGKRRQRRVHEEAGDERSPNGIVPSTAPHCCGSAVPRRTPCRTHGDHPATSGDVRLRQPPCRFETTCGLNRKSSDESQRLVAAPAGPSTTTRRCSTCRTGR